jgi:hypothetical protein
MLMRRMVMGALACTILVPNVSEAGQRPEAPRKEKRRPAAAAPAEEVVDLPCPFVDGAELTYDMTTQRAGMSYDTTMVLRAHDVDPTGFSLTVLTSLFEINTLPEAMRPFFAELEGIEGVDPVLRYAFGEAVQIINLDAVVGSMEPIRAAFRTMMTTQGQGPEATEQLIQTVLGAEAIANTTAAPISPLLNNTCGEIPLGVRSGTVERTSPLGVMPSTVTYDIQRPDPQTLTVAITTEADRDVLRAQALSLLKTQLPEGTDLTAFEAEFANFELEVTETTNAEVDIATGVVRRYRHATIARLPGQPTREDTREVRLASPR